MSGPGKRMILSRRPVLAGLAATSAAALTAIVLDIFSEKHPRVSGPYAGLVNRLDNPQAAAVVGNAMLAKVADRDAAIREAESFARERFVHERLSQAIATDTAHGFLAEADGWVMPLTLGALCVLASQSPS